MLEIYDLTTKKELKPYIKDIKSYYKKVIETLELKDEVNFSLIICGKKKIRTINKQYRNIDKETDVISFANIDSDDFDYLDEEDLNLGDIFINVDRVKSQAKEYEHSIKREFVFLFVHGFLHLLGYDHMKEEDEKLMFYLQDKIIGDLK
ncbi:MAG: rRNA maturation RNase YbeY [Erysipelotrichaceae bacterium]|nr:rRNA maturation RNase YbeY [Erysipelotrichaceae bacterium]